MDHILQQKRPQNIHLFPKGRCAPPNPTPSHPATPPIPPPEIYPPPSPPLPARRRLALGTGEGDATEAAAEPEIGEVEGPSLSRTDQQRCGGRELGTFDGDGSYEFGHLTDQGVEWGGRSMNRMYESHESEWSVEWGVCVTVTWGPFLFFNFFGVGGVGTGQIKVLVFGRCIWRGSDVNEFDHV